jgi:hypothetical protein
MLVVRVLLGDAKPQVKEAMEAASLHLRNLGALEGDVPQYGDWDEGRVLTDSCPAGSVAGSTWAGLALSGRQVPTSKWTEHDELAWYVGGGSSATVVEPDAPMEGGAVAGTFHVLRHGPWRAWVKTGSAPSHQHADIGSVWIAYEGRWIVRDPGTGTYNGPLTVRNGLRGSTAHPVWRPGNVDQLVPHRAFRWLRHVHPQADARFTPARSLVLSVHDAFVEECGSRVARLVDMDESGPVIVDFIECTGDRSWQMTVPLGDGERPLAGLPSSTVSGAEDPFVGWHSDTYGEWHPSPWAVAELSGSCHVWGVSDNRVVTDATSAQVGHRCYSVTWDTGRVAIRVIGGGDGVDLETVQG